MHCEISEYKWVVLTGLEHVWLQIGLPTDGFIGHPAANAAVPKFNCNTRVNTQNNDVCPFDIFNPYIAPDVFTHLVRPGSHLTSLPVYKWSESVIIV